MRLRSRRVGAAALGVLLAALLCACSSEVAGSPRALSSSPDISALRVQTVASVDLRKKFNESPQSINEYWSAKRLSEAKPRDPGAPTTPPTTSPSPSTPSTPAPSTPSTPPSTPRSTPRPSPPVQDPGVGRVIPPTRGHPRATVLANSTAGNRFHKVGLAKSTAGRLYYAFGNLNYVCSATVVHSASRDIVATAGHCVWDTEHGNGWGRNYMFIPADSNNGSSAPYGRWFAKRVYTTKAFIATAKEKNGRSYGSGWAYDSAFLKMSKSNGRKIQTETGGQGIAFGAPVRSLMVIGYPTQAPFNGRSERYCSSSSWYTGEFGDRTINCRMTPGCSGGGWLSSYNPGDGAGYLIGMTSLWEGRWVSTAMMGGAASNTFDLAVRGG